MLNPNPNPNPNPNTNPNWTIRGEVDGAGYRKTLFLRWKPSVGDRVLAMEWIDLLLIY